MGNGNARVVNQTGSTVPVGLLSKLKKPSDAHSINTIKANTRFGGGNRNTQKTIAKGNVDLEFDYNEIISGKATFNSTTQTFTTSTGRIYGFHPDNISTGRSSAIYPISGNPGDFVDVTQAEFDILTKMIDNGGLNGSAKKALDGMLTAGNSGLDANSATKLIDLYNSKK